MCSRKDIWEFLFFFLAKKTSESWRSRKETFVCSRCYCSTCTRYGAPDTHRLWFSWCTCFSRVHWDPVQCALNGGTGWGLQRRCNRGFQTQYSPNVSGVAPNTASDMGFSELWIRRSILTGTERVSGAPNVQMASFWNIGSRRWASPNVSGAGTQVAMDMSGAHTATPSRG